MVYYFWPLATGFWLLSFGGGPLMFWGYGILRGMAVTFKNFIDSYFRPAEEGGLFTVEYPDKRLPEKERFRNFPFLIYDGTPDNLRCVACDICAKECPPKCIYIVREFDKDGRPLKRPAVFDIDFTVCMNCGICEEACPFDAIYMDHEFQIADTDRQERLLYHKEGLLKSNEYFHKIRPTDAAAIDARRREAEEKKKTAQAAAAKAAQPQPTPPPKPTA
jgi:NADH-quinone oxidoreductase subunit I